MAGRIPQRLFVNKVNVQRVTDSSVDDTANLAVAHLHKAVCSMPE